MTGVIPGAAVDLLSFGQDNTVSLPPSFPPVCFLLFSLASCIPFLSTLSYNYHMHSLLSLCVTVTKFHKTHQSGRELGMEIMLPGMLVSLYII